MNRQIFLEQLLDRAGRAGFSAAEVYLASGRGLEVRLFERKLDHYEHGSQCGLCFRGLVDGKMGYAFSELLEEQSIPFLLEEAAANAAILDEQELEDLFAGEPCQPARTWSDELAAIGPARMIEAAAALEDAALTYDRRISGVDYALSEYRESERLIANTLGLQVSQKSNLLLAYGSVKAQEGQSIKKGSELWQGRSQTALDPAAVGREAARRAVVQLGARPVPSGTYDVLFDRQAAADLLQTFLPVFFADKIQQGLSMLNGKIGQPLGSSVLTLIDEPFCPASYYQPAFDSEGAATRRKLLLTQGVLTAVLHNRKTARREQTQTTGNGFKPSYQSAVQVAATNCYFAPGTASQAELMAPIARGLLITDLSGLHAGTNLVSGDFSLLAEGLLIEQGSCTVPVEQITVAGNFYQLLKQITAVGSDLWFDLPHANGQTGSPSLLAEGLDISGL